MYMISNSLNRNMLVNIDTQDIACNAGKLIKILDNRDSNNDYDYVDISDTLKIIIPIGYGPFHLHFDTINTFFTMYNLYPDAKFIFFSNVIDKTSKSIYDFFVFFLDDNRVDHVILSDKQEYLFRLNNFITKASYHNFYHTDENLILKYFKKYLKSNNVIPNNMVYLDRSSIHQIHREYDSLGNFNNMSTNTSARINDDDIIKQYFIDNKYDVVVPETDFSDYIEQINYFYSVKTIASITSSGLSNMCLMQKNGIVFEILTTVVSDASITPISDDYRPYIENKRSHRYEEIHPLYHFMSYIFDHNYYAISNKTKSSYDLIEKIEKSSIKKVIF